MLAMDARFPWAAVIALFVLLFHPQSPVEAAGHWSHWGQWTPCSVTCGSGISSKERVWVRGPGEPTYKEPFTAALILSCTDETYPECPAAGHWGHWGPWTPCSVTCGSGTSSKERVWIPGPREPPSEVPYTSTDVSSCTHDTECPGQLDLNTDSDYMYDGKDWSINATFHSPKPNDTVSSESKTMASEPSGPVGLSPALSASLTMDLASSGSLATDFDSSTQTCSLLIALMFAAISARMLY